MDAQGSDPQAIDAAALSGTPEVSPLRKLGALFSRTDRRRLVRLFYAIVLMAFLQVVGIASVLPFLDLASRPDAMETSPRLREIYGLLGLTSNQSALIATGIAVVALLAISNAASAWLVLQRQRIAWSVAHHLSMRLVEGYVALPYRFFLGKSSADLIKKNISDVNGIVNGIVLEGSKLATHLITSAMILTLLAFVEPVATLLACGVLVAMFGTVGVVRHRYLSQLGRRSLDSNQRRFESFVDLVGGIKTVKTDGAQDFFVSRFERASRDFSIVNPKVQSAASIPRFAVEVVAMGGVVLATLYLVIDGTDLGEAMPSLTLFAIAAYRLIPAIGGAYSAYVSVVSSFPAVESIHEDLQDPGLPVSSDQRPIEFRRSIDVDRVCFHYDAADPPVLRNVSLSVARGEKVAFVGPSGSGKSTLIDTIVGLFQPASGEVLIDGIPLDASKRDSWRARIGYVPQMVFLYDDTIARNVAFGMEKVDRERLREACEWAQLGPLIGTLSRGLDTMLGENGIRLSGGERQRIGLARAFYRQPDVLVLDEATSALDGRTETAVIDAISRHMPDATTLMIAHRISTVRHCDRLFVMDRGTILAEGTFEALIEGNALFQELAHIS